MLRDAGAHIDQARRDGCTPLFSACINGCRECARLLCDAGADIDQVNQVADDGAAPIMVACCHGRLKCVQLLSAYGASREPTPFGTPMVVAVREGYHNVAVWLEDSRWWAPLAHLEVLTAARSRELLAGGASLHAGWPTPLQRATGAEGEVAALVRRAAEPWSSASHSLFPAPARARAVELLRIGYLLAFSPRFCAEASSLADAWRAHVLTHAVTREAA